MKRLLVVLVSLTGILILTGIFMLFSKETGGPAKIFQLKEKETEKISRIVVKSDTASLILKKEKNGWTVNGRWPVRARSVKVLKKVLQHMEVKSPVSAELAEKVPADTAARHVEVSIYRGLLPLKRFEVYAGGRIPGGNMMRLAGKKKWYIVYLPVEQVNPALFFFTDPHYWRDPALFNYLPGEVLEVQMDFGGHPAAGYRVGLDTLSHHYYFIPQDTSLRFREADTARIRTYLSWFQHLDCDEWDRSLPEAAKDSILRQKPLYTVTVKDVRGGVFRMQVYPLPNRHPAPGAPATDPDVARAWVLPLREMVLIKYYRIDPLMQEVAWFVKDKG